jgi:secondary thiamine-phosphate synthase enzyme
MIKTRQISINTKGNCEVINITEQVQSVASDSGISDGIVTLFVVGSTAGITTTEYEPGLVKHDIADLFEKIAPAGAGYKHEQTWNDDNGHSHLRASLLGPCLTVPIINGELPLGTWQQIVLIEFDTRPRTRTIICQFISQ